MTMTSPVTKLTKDVGTTIKPGPMVVAHPDQVMTDADLKAVSGNTGLNGPFLADLLGSFATHENMGVNLFRALRGVSANPMLVASYTKFEADGIAAVEAYETLITALGGKPKYISPPGRMTEGLDSKMIESLQGAGSADPMTVELKGVEMVLLASTMCVANTALLTRIAEGIDEGPAKTAMETAVTTLYGPQQQHLEWAAKTQQTLVLTQVKSRLAQQAGAVMETVAGKIKDVLT